jgi:hypothetical protein
MDPECGPKPGRAANVRGGAKAALPRSKKRVEVERIVLPDSDDNEESKEQAFPRKRKAFDNS